MAKFKVCVQQYVEEITTVTVEADTAEEAAAIGRQMLSDGNLDNWTAGDDAMNQDVYAVLDQSGESVWER